MFGHHHFYSDKRPTRRVPSTNAQTLLAKALSEQITKPETVALVALASKSIQNSSLAANLATNFVIDLITIRWFETVLHLSCTPTVQLAPKLSFSLSSTAEDFKRDQFVKLISTLKNQTNYLHASLTAVAFDRFDLCRLLFHHRIDEENDAAEEEEKTFPHLTSIHLDWCSDSTSIPFSVFTSSTKIEQNDNSFLSRILPSSLVSPNLTSLDLVGCRVAEFRSQRPEQDPRFSSSSPELVFSPPSTLDSLVRFPKLEHLNLHRSSWLESTHLRSLCELRNLTHLNLTDCTSVTDEGIVKFVCTIESLRELILNGISSLQHETFKSIANTLSELRVLHLASCYNVTDASIEEFTKLEHLTSLNLYSCYQVTIKSKESFIKMKNRLKKLTLADVSAFNFMARMELRNLIPGLEV